MSLYAWWFESRLARSDSPATRTLSSRGLAIPGLAPATWDEILATPPCRARLDALLDEAASLPAEPIGDARGEGGPGPRFPRGGA